MWDYDVVIVGSGAAGLFCALHIDPRLRVLTITKSNIRESNSYLAQGGITTVRGEEDKASFVQDTLRAGNGENDISAVSLLADNAAKTILDLVSLHVPFETHRGRLLYTREGAHSKSRIVYAKDETGKFLVETLIGHVGKQENITVWEHTSLVDIVEQDGCSEKRCVGVLAEKQGQAFPLTCRKTVLACGGIGGLFKNTTNQNTVAGDALAIAHAHGIKLKHVEYIQFHPTALFEPSRQAKRRFLISESLRGEGAYLLNQSGQRFVDELLPRDAVTSAILKEQRKSGGVPSVYLDISHKGGVYIKDRFPNIYKSCLEAGYDITAGPVPVTPAQHYHMGGIGVDLRGRTSMDNLYAIGEAACSGVHGANRLASNSLLEALVYAKEAAEHINASVKEKPQGHMTGAGGAICYQALLDADYRAGMVKSLLKKERDDRQDELFDFR